MGNVDLPMLDGELLQPNNYCLGEVECALGAKLLERSTASTTKSVPAPCALSMLWPIFLSWSSTAWTHRHNYHLLAARTDHGR